MSESADRERPDKIGAAKRAIGRAYNRYRNWSHNVNQAGEDADRAIARGVRRGAEAVVDANERVADWARSHGAGQGPSKARALTPHVERGLNVAGDAIDRVGVGALHLAFGKRKPSYKEDAAWIAGESQSASMTEEQALAVLDRELGPSRPGTDSPALFDKVEEKIAEIERAIQGANRAYVLEREKITPGGVFRSGGDRKRDRLEEQVQARTTGLTNRAQRLDIALAVALGAPARRRTIAQGREWRKAQKKTVEEVGRRPSRPQDAGREDKRRDAPERGEDARALAGQIEAALRRVMGAKEEGVSKKELEALKGEVEGYRELERKAREAGEQYVALSEKLGVLVRQLAELEKSQKFLEEKVGELEEARRQKEARGETEKEKRARLGELAGTRESPGLIRQAEVAKSREATNPRKVEEHGALVQEKEEIERWLKENSGQEDASIARLEALSQAAQRDFEEKIERFSASLGETVDDIEGARSRVLDAERGANEAQVRAREAQAHAESALASILERAQKLGIAEDDISGEESQDGREEEREELASPLFEAGQTLTVERLPLQGTMGVTEVSGEVRIVEIIEPGTGRGIQGRMGDEAVRAPVLEERYYLIAYPLEGETGGATGTISESKLKAYLERGSPPGEEGGEDARDAEIRESQRERAFFESLRAFEDRLEYFMRYPKELTRDYLEAEFETIQTHLRAVPKEDDPQGEVTREMTKEELVAFLKTIFRAVETVASEKARAAREEPDFFGETEISSMLLLQEKYDSASEYLSDRAYDAVVFLEDFPQRKRTPATNRRARAVKPLLEAFHSESK